MNETPLSDKKYLAHEQNEKAAVKSGAVKYDSGKPTAYSGFLTYFPRAASLVASVSDFGAKKYARDGWRHVDNGFNRYSDAMVRHLLAEATGEIYDTDSGLFTIGHTCWNSLARTELWLMKKGLT